MGIRELKWDDGNYTSCAQIDLGDQFVTLFAENVALTESAESWDTWYTVDSRAANKYGNPQVIGYFSTREEAKAALGQIAKQYL
jgi:hypothetical protein